MEHLYYISRYSWLFGLIACGGPSTSSERVIFVAQRKQACQIQEVEAGAKIDCPDQPPVIVRHGTDGTNGNDGQDGAPGTQGIQGVAGQDGAPMELVQTVVCKDDVPNYSGVRFYMVISYFSTGDYYSTLTMFDDETTLGAGTSWNDSVIIFRDKFKNDDWATFKFSVDLPLLTYTSEYEDPVDGNEIFTVLDKCTLHTEENES